MMNNGTLKINIDRICWH